MQYITKSLTQTPPKMITLELQVHQQTVSRHKQPCNAILHAPHSDLEIKGKWCTFINEHKNTYDETCSFSSTWKENPFCDSPVEMHTVVLASGRHTPKVLVPQCRDRGNRCGVRYTKKKRSYNKASRLLKSMSNFNCTEMTRVVEAPNTFLAECAAGSKSTQCVSDKIL